MTNAKETYLGDGVYVKLDEYGGIILTTGSHKEEEASNTIFLGPDEISMLLKYLKQE